MKLQVIALGVICAGALSMVTVQADETVVKEHAKVDKTKNRFAMADTNHNGSVSMDEFKAVYAKRPAKTQVKEGDVATAPQTAEAAFDKLDTDKSGTLSKEEMLAGRTRGKGKHKAVKNVVEPAPAK
jgi:Ca2+-binding EF-hand superfamily protein